MMKTIEITGKEFESILHSGVDMIRTETTGLLDFTIELKIFENGVEIYRVYREESEDRSSCWKEIN